MRIIPLENRILIIPIEDELNSEVRRTQTEGKQRPEKGKVVGLGKTYKGILKEGNVVYFQKFDVEKLEIKNKEYYIGLPDAFFCVIR